MAWFRLHEGAYADAKWPIIARKANTNVGTVVSVWIALLDYASQNETRGSLDGFDPETIDALYGYDDGICQSVLDAMVCKGMIKDGRVVNWDKRQPKKEDAASTERAREYRVRQKTQSETQRNAMKRDETDCNAMKRDETPDKIREEDIKNINLNTPPLNPPGGTGGGGAAPSGPEPDLEFCQLRELWDSHMRSEGPRAGFRAYLALKKARAWPGLCLIEHDVTRRKEAGAWNPGFEPGLDKYLSERVWLGPMPRARGAPALTEYQQRKEEQRELARMLLRKEASNGAENAAI